MTAVCLNNNDIPQAFAVLDYYFDELDNEQGMLVLLMFLKRLSKKKSRVPSMEKIFQKFKAAGKFTFTSEVNALMCRAHAKVGNLAMMEKYLEEMQKLGIDKSFNGEFILRAYIKNGTKRLAKGIS